MSKTYCNLKDNKQGLNIFNKNINSITHLIDKVVLHRLLGLPIFLLVMYLMFIFSINVGGAFQEFFDLSSQAIFIEGIKNVLSNFSLPQIITTLLADGVGRGINVTISFIPVLFCMFFFLAFLETSGYIARASFIMSKFMGFLGLPGKAFVPMVIGFGCNVPAVLSARTLENEDDRAITILMAPFMSCSARLAIYTMFVAAFFPSRGQNVIFALYITGMVVAILTGLLLRKTILHGDGVKFNVELSNYRLPRLTRLLKLATYRLKNFIFKSMQLIIPFCIVIGGLGAIKEKNSNYFLLDQIGKSCVKVFSPMGISNDNWPAVVGLLSGMIGKEVMVGTLNSLYVQEYKKDLHNLNALNKNYVGNNAVKSKTIANNKILENNVVNNSVVKNTLDNAKDNNIVANMLKSAALSIPKNLIAIKDSLMNPLLNKPVYINDSVLGVLYTKFNGSVAAFSYLLFVLLYFPCISVVVTISKELNKTWALFAVFWSTGLAYIVSTTFYQVATFLQHPMFSTVWLLGILMICGFYFFIFLKYAKTSLYRDRRQMLSTKILIKAN